jgi:hypothetical protein
MVCGCENGVHNMHKNNILAVFRAFEEAGYLPSPPRPPAGGLSKGIRQRAGSVAIYCP